jgi:hypothetical protein
VFAFASVRGRREAWHTLRPAAEPRYTSQQASP